MRVNSRSYLRVLIIAVMIAAAGVFSDTSSASLLNGNFDIDGTSPDPFANWTTLTSIGYKRPTAGSDAHGDQFVLFEELGIGTQLQQVFDVPANALTLSFEYRFEIVSGTPGGFPPDNFQSILFDAAIFPLLGAPPLNLAFYSLDGFNTPTYDPGFVATETITSGPRSGWTRVTLDVRGIASQPNVTLDFSLNSIDPNTMLKVYLDNVILNDGTTGSPNVIPEPISLCVWSMLVICCGLVFHRRCQV